MQEVAQLRHHDQVGHAPKQSQFGMLAEQIVECRVVPALEMASVHRNDSSKADSCSRPQIGHAQDQIASSEGLQRCYIREGVPQVLQHVEGNDNVKRLEPK